MMNLDTDCIAPAWGDGDALAEAGFCYARGVGCKKDLKKSAKLYRQAESKGTALHSVLMEQSTSKTSVS